MPCQGTWRTAPIVDAAATTITLALNKTDTGDPKCVRYNWYNAACMPTAGKGLCAIYGAGAGGVWLPAPPFILAVATGE